MVSAQAANDFATDSISSHTNALSPQIPKPSLLQRAYLKGILHRPRDIIFLVRLIVAAVWAMVRLHCIELPFMIVTFFKYPTKQHALGWPWWLTISMSFIRAIGPQIRTIGHLRFVGLFIEAALPLQVLFARNVKVERNVQFRVRLNALLRPERASLAQIRQELRSCGYSDDVTNPSKEYLDSMHLPAHGPQARLSNIPEEVGHLDKDGTYVLKGEWIEAVYSSNEGRPRNNTVVLYFHGGGHGFLSPASHREFLCRLAKDIGPGARIFSVDYRMGPEHPVPAAIHDAFAAYLYLTEPTHEALILDDKKSCKERVPVDPRDVVVGGDSAGANLAAAFMLYMTKYVQPSTSPKFVLPHATILVSVWADPTSSLPTAHSDDCYCYCPGPIGVHPFNKSDYVNFHITNKMNFASNYICGDFHTSPNPRNSFGLDREWEWYSHLAQHPLVSPVHRANLSELGNTLVHTGTHDRLVDDNRLFAHRLGKENPEKLIRIEVYKDMVHVHHVLSRLKLSRIATRNISRFIERSKHFRDVEEGAVPKDEYRQFDYKDMVKARAADGVEWVMVDQDGMEEAKDEGWPMNVLIKSWPPSYIPEI
ncbi:hypothetical protein BGZ80_010417 [Entomortierella chlamydospora]|uniref:Alpha/beta hydrolase fold-3 domain-containing protein n=1 Tax=Entomortierella chlamydospora TaxID=101097 RepID=A0A9P6MUX5_9FUNG|nr:hypothetical protein BGZ79_008734 [Entomortierella chlamydospora]KAG0014482.1 hypothetical protein BGZ80_010417 [Entomortierella chlamydospora]